MTPIHIQWADDGQHIRKWARDPFAGSTEYTPVATPIAGIHAVTISADSLRDLVDRPALASAPAGDAFADAGKPIAPAGDGVEAEPWRERWYGSDPQKGSAIVTEGGSLVCHLGGDEDTHRLTTAIVAAHNAALARPRAAVGERERARHIETLKWLKSGYLPGGPRDVWGACQAGINALQSPPAKVEGEHPSAAIDRLAARMAKADGADWDQSCGHENDLDSCTVASCIGTQSEDHDPDWARDLYRRHARVALGIDATPTD